MHRAMVLRSVWGSALLVVALWLGGGCLGSSGSKSLGRGHDFGHNNPDLVLVLGDSISAGGFSGGGAPWPARFANMVGKRVINDGIPGAASGVGAARIGGLLNSSKPGYVVIFYGANDAITGANANSSAAAIQSMVAAAKNNQSIPVVANVMPMAGERVIFNERVAQLNERIHYIVRAEGAKLVNVHRAVRRNPELYLSDGLHLSDAGEEMIALEFMDAFK